MAVLTFHKVTALPQQLQPNSVYFVSIPAKPEYMEIYVTGTTASVVKRVLNEDDIRALIQAELAGFQSIRIVENIEERNNLNPTAAIFVLVLDASDDPTVESGSASYIYNPSTQQWIKIAEYESMDLILSWDKIQGRPTSPPSAIDDAVDKRHMHANKTQLDKVGEDAQGNFQYGGAYPRIAWDTTAW